MATNAADQQWTEAQERGITAVGKSLLVSAAAGSGKTTVLAERCVHLLCDAAEPCDVADLLVVTFTEPAAAEMKSRIGAALARRHAQSPSPHTTRQIALLDRANVGTLHGFCSRVLRQHFHRVGLDPDFLILDGDEASLLKRETARQLLEDRYEDEAADTFRTFVDCYGSGNGEQLVSLIVAAHDTLGSMIDPAQWATAAHDRIAEAIELPLNQSQLGKVYLREIQQAMATLADEAQSAIAVIRGLGSFPKYIERLAECGQIIRRWQKLLSDGEVAALASEAEGLQFPRMSAVASSVPNKEPAKGAMDAVVNALKSGTWRSALRYTEAERQDGLAQILPHLDTFLSLTSQFNDRYTQAKTRQNTLDFSDLERQALRVLREDGPGLKPSPIARGYHRQFKHVLVDEYQDINQLQDAILCLVSRECLMPSIGNPPLSANLFCVGDVKQSIYRFRLAEPGQFIRRRKDYAAGNTHGEVIDLQENFRSRAPLLDAINSLFERMMTEAAVDLQYDRSQWLHGKRQFPPATAGAFTGSPIELHLVPDAKSSASNDSEDEEDEPLDRTSREATVLARRILELVGKTGVSSAKVVDRATNEYRPAKFSDIVVLLRAMKFKTDAFADTLRAAGVPVHTDSGTGYFEATEINDVLSLLHVLDNRSQDIPLAALLRSPLGGLSEPDTAMATIRVAYPTSISPPLGGGVGATDAHRERDSPTTIDAVETPAKRGANGGDKERIAFHDAVVRYAREKDDELAGQLKSLLATLDCYRDVARQRPVAELVWLILQETGYLAYVAGLNGGQQRTANLLELYDRAGQFGTFRRQGLSRFLEFLEKLKSESDLGQASIASPVDDVVRIMSIHRSKGLEFPIVCVPDLGKKINIQDCQGSVLLDRDLGLGFDVVDLDRQIRYPSLASEVVSKRLKQQTLAEEMRVLYVAMTRAEEHLILAGSCSTGQAEAWTQRWGGHAGPLPVESILKARTILDWLGAAAAATAGGSAPSVEIFSHGDDEDSLEAAPSSDHDRDGRLADLAALRPLSPPPAANPHAQAVIDRLTRHYPFERLDTTPASQSVTGITHGGHQAPASTQNADSIDEALTLPALSTGTQPLSATDRGSATHIVLEHLDFTKSADVDAIHRQIKNMIEQNRLSETEGAAVDVSAIDWFLHTDVGQLLCKAGNRAQRELALYLAHPPDGMAGVPLDPMDHIMVRGRIDLLVPEGEGWAIVDYKTDQVSGEALVHRANEYAMQLQLYRRAIVQITGKPVTRAVLVFLTAREVREV